MASQREEFPFHRFVKQPESLHSDIQTEMSVFSWSSKDHFINPYRKCFSCYYTDKLPEGLSFSLASTIKTDSLEIRHVIIRSTEDVTSEKFEELWKSIDWRECDIKKRNKESFWYPRPGTTQMRWLENLLSCALYKGEDPNDYAALELYSLIRRDQIESVSDIVRSGLGQACLRLLEFVVKTAKDELAESNKSDDQDEVDIIINGESLIAFLKREDSAIAQLTVKCSTDQTQQCQGFTKGGSQCLNRKSGLSPVWCHHHKPAN